MEQYKFQMVHNFETQFLMGMAGTMAFQYPAL